MSHTEIAVSGAAVFPQDYGPEWLRNVRIGGAERQWIDQRGFVTGFDVRFALRLNKPFWFHFPIPTPIAIGHTVQRCEHVYVLYNVPAPARLREVTVHTESCRLVMLSDGSPGGQTNHSGRPSAQNVFFTAEQASPPVSLRYPSMRPSGVDKRIGNFVSRSRRRLHSLAQRSSKCTVFTAGSEPEACRRIGLRAARACNSPASGNARTSLQTRTSQKGGSR